MTVSSSGDQPDSAATPVHAADAAPAASEAAGRDISARMARNTLVALLVLTGLALTASLVLWQRLGHIQEQLARQSADSGAQAIEARALAREAQELARQTAARQAVTDTRLSDVALQRNQLDELMQSLSRSRDENLVVDLESALRLAQQQSQLTLSPEPLLAALRAADRRLERAAQPRLSRVRSAIQRDIERIRSAAVGNVPGVLVRIDELARMVDELPVANAVGPAALARGRSGDAGPPQSWWLRAVDVVREEARGLLRVSRIDEPDAALLSPEQGFFLRENVKLKLLNARLSVLARQTELARADLAAAQSAIARYFDSGRRTQAMTTSLQQLQAQLRDVETPRIDDTLALLDATAAGR
ncbi:uroporphyrinogen-III C-methyltransferase [Ramlibacter sp. AN1015]|uniref:uroporphyrinogen-III C-methyltransferase n=1 Tax=Ramlibacter sp. AN1015 TaxID=3133428 RepID=UPI0030BC061A